jgi:ribonuclease VapC
MIVDSSALVAVALREPEETAFMSAMRDAETCAVGAPSLLETSMVLWPVRPETIDALIDSLGLVVVGFESHHLTEARAAYARYGKGTGSPAKLNFGDCISYALAKVSGEPLLFKGDDFTHTDITPAWVPASG